MRIIVLYFVVFGFSLYAWRNWFVSLCVLILLMSVLQNKEMPRTLLGIQGLNLWNILMVNVLLSWWSTRQREGWQWDIPPPIGRAFMVIVLLIVVGFVRFALDFRHFHPENMEGAEPASFLGSTSEYLINTLKWLLPGILLFDGCRTVKRQYAAVVTITALYVLLGLLTIRYMYSHLGALVSGGLDHDSARILHKHVGYFRVSLSMMLAGGSWAVMSFFPMAKTRLTQLILLGTSGMVLVAQALTGGRAGYATWALVGLVFGVARYRKMLLLVPVVALAVIVLLPGVASRVMTGVGGHEEEGIVQDENEAVLTAGRSLVWPVVIAEIRKSLLFGDGRKTYDRHNLQQKVGDLTGDGGFGHPHCAYLEFMLDNGVLGFLAIMPFFYLTVKYSFKLLLVRDNPLCSAVGGVSTALVLSFLIASSTAQTLYPVAYVVGMWAAIGLMFRVAVEHERSLAHPETAAVLEAEPEMQEATP